MLARVLRPLQHAARRTPVVAHVLGLGCAVGILAAAPEIGGEAIARATLAAAAPAFAAWRLVPGLVAAGCATVSGALCAALGDMDSAPIAMAATAAATALLTWGTAKARTLDAAELAWERGTACIGLLLQLMLPWLLFGGWKPVVAIAAGCALAVLWLPATTRRPEQPKHPGQPRPLPPEPVAARKWVWTGRAAMAVLAVVATQQAWSLPGWQAAALAATAGVWWMVTGRALLAIGATASGAIVAAATGGLGVGADPAPLAVAWAVPLLAWWARTHGELRQAPMILGTLLAAALLWRIDTGSAAPFATAIAAWLAVLAFPEETVAEGQPLRRAAAAAWHLPAYWRFYLRAKLRFDPVYRQLAADAQPWGRVLDAGCGPGIAAALAAARPDVSGYCGIDLDEGKLAAARRLLGRLGHGLDANWRLLNGRLPLPQPLPRAFDTALLLDVLHYWDEATQATMLAQLRAALVDGGRLWLREGVVEGRDAGRVELGERFTTATGLNPDGGGLRFFTRERLEAMLGTAGFRVDDCQASGAENRLFHCTAV